MPKQARARRRAVKSAKFDPDCRRCPRLAGVLARIRTNQPDYHARPVAPFGARRARVLIVGLAPGLNGANRTGRPFTGDYAGILLYRTLHRLGLANRPEASARNDGLKLIDCRITNAVKCWPPANKPTGEEIATCNGYLANELNSLPPGTVVLALGAIAHKAVLMAQRLRLSAFPFKHGAVHRLPSARTLVDSYHCSRYNTQTGRLTEKMFFSAVAKARKLARPRP